MCACCDSTGLVARGRVGRVGQFVGQLASPPGLFSGRWIHWALGRWRCYYITMSVPAELCAGTAPRAGIFRELGTGSLRRLGDDRPAAGLAPVQRTAVCIHHHRIKSIEQMLVPSKEVRARSIKAGAAGRLHRVMSCGWPLISGRWGLGSSGVAHAVADPPPVHRASASRPRVGRGSWGSAARVSQRAPSYLGRCAAARLRRRVLPVRCVL